MILYPTKNKALERGYAQPGAPPYVSLFRTLLTLIQKQEVDYFALYTHVQYCSILFEMRTSKKQGLACVGQVSPLCALPLHAKLFCGLYISAGASDQGTILNWIC